MNRSTDGIPMPIYATFRDGSCLQLEHLHSYRAVLSRLVPDEDISPEDITVLIDECERASAELARILVDIEPPTGPLGIAFLGDDKGVA